MGDLVKTFDASGVAPDGKLYAGDLNAIQAAKADQEDFSATFGIGTVQIGDSGIQLLKYGTGEARLTSRLRLDGGLLIGTYTTTQRDAITSPPKGLVVFNSTTNRYEVNLGTSGTPYWAPVYKMTRGFVALGTLTWSGSSQVSSAINVAHGLGETPTSVQVTPAASDLLTANPSLRAESFGGTNFSVQGWTIDGQTPGAGASSAFSWLAIV